MLTKNKLTPEKQIERWEDRRDIKNLMGRFAYDLLVKNEKEIYAQHWSQRADACLMFPWGTYKGAQAVQGYYDALHRYNGERALWYGEMMPEKTKNLTEEELYGIGSYHGMHLTTPAIVVADDGETAQAIYWCHDVYDVMCEAGNAGKWDLGLLFIDLVYENDSWKIWHLRCAFEVSGPHGQPFGTAFTLPGEPIPYLQEKLAQMKQWFPQPNDPTPSHEMYAIGREKPQYPPCPRPYETWQDSQSYGI